jgi:hypothetical protein
VALLLLACAVLPAAGLNVPAPDLDDLKFSQFKAQLRWESYARAGCAVTGGCFDECLKGGLQVYDKPEGDTTGSSIYLLSRLDNPPGSECRCPPAFGNMNAAKTNFTGSYSGEPLTLTVDGAGILVNWAGCAHVYAVEEQFDRDGDGMPDFLGVNGAVKDTIPPIIGEYLANAITATVAATIFANVGTALVEKLLQLLSMKVKLSDLKDARSLAQGIDLQEVGVTGGALVPLIQQAGYLGIIGQIGGRGSVPAVTSRLSEGLSWTNFHLPRLFSSYPTDSAPAVRLQHNLVASRRRHMRRVRAGREETKGGVSNKNFASPWVYSVVTFLHRDVFKRPIRVDWAGQYTRKTLKHMLMGRMSCLWAPRHSEPPMLVVNLHQAGSATLELQQHVWMALQAVRARYPEAQHLGRGTRMHTGTEKGTPGVTRDTCNWSTTNSRRVWPQSKEHSFPHERHPG